MEQQNGKNYFVKIRGTNFYLKGHAKTDKTTLLFTDERPEFGRYTFDRAKQIVNGFSQPEKFEIEFITIGHPEIIVLNESVICDQKNGCTPNDCHYPNCECDFIPRQIKDESL